MGYGHMEYGHGARAMGRIRNLGIQDGVQITRYGFEDKIGNTGRNCPRHWPTTLHFVTVLLVQDMHWHSWTLVHAMYVRSMYVMESQTMEYVHATSTRSTRNGNPKYREVRTRLPIVFNAVLPNHRGFTIVHFPTPYKQCK